MDNRPIGDDTNCIRITVPQSALRRDAPEICADKEISGIMMRLAVVIRNMNGEDRVGLTLSPVLSALASKVWYCDCEGDMIFHNRLPNLRFSKKKFSKVFGYAEELRTVYFVPLQMCLDPTQGYLQDDSSIIVEARITIKNDVKLFRKSSIDFSVPSELADATIIFGNRRFHAGKQMLAAQSTFFKKLFYGRQGGGDRDAEQKEFDITDFFGPKMNALECPYLHDPTEEEMEMIFKYIYQSGLKIDEANYYGLLMTAYNLGTQGLLEEIEKWLIQESDFSPIQKLLDAQNYQLAALHGFAMAELRTREEVVEVRNSNLFALLDEKIKMELFDKHILLSTARPDDDAHELTRTE